MKVSILSTIGTPNAIIQKFGLLVFNKVSELIDEAEQQVIELSFEGLENITTGFCNASIGNLYKKYGLILDSKIEFTGFESNEHWKERVKDAKALALNPELESELDKEIEKLFE